MLTLKADINPELRHSPAVAQRRTSPSHSPNYENMAGEREREGPGIGRIEGEEFVLLMVSSETHYFH